MAAMRLRRRIWSFVIFFLVVISLQVCHGWFWNSETEPATSKGEIKKMDEKCDELKKEEKAGAIVVNGEEDTASEKRRARSEDEEGAAAARMLAEKNEDQDRSNAAKESSRDRDREIRREAKKESEEKERKEAKEEAAEKKAQREEEKNEAASALLAKKDLQKEMEDRHRREKEKAKQEMMAEEQRQKSGDVNKYMLTLKNIYFSNGELEPQFSPDHFDYDLNLNHPHDMLAITPEIFKERPEYKGGEEMLPLIEVIWDGGVQNVVVEPSAVAIRRQIDLPNDGSDVNVRIRVVNPSDDHKYVTYSIRVKQAGGKIILLKGLEAADDNGNPVRIDPLPARDVLTYTAYVNPETRTLNVRPSCLSGWVTIDGQSAENERPFAVVRDLKRHVQIVEISCGRGRDIWHAVTSRNYFLKVISEYARDEIPMPRIVVENVGQECRKSDSKYDCPDPKEENSKTQLLGFIEPRIRYTIESPDKEVHVRLLNQIPTVPFSYRSDLLLKAVAGTYSVEWPLHFNVPLGAGLLGIIGLILGTALGLLLCSQALVLGSSSLLGVGLPVGLTEISSILFMMLQYLCYSNFFTTNNFFEDTTRALKWFTLFIPLPWDLRGHTVGDISDLSNAYGCIFWCFAIFASAVAIHLATLIKFHICEAGFTFPHSALLGGFESRLANILIFPLTTASAAILSNSDANVFWKVLAAFSIILVSVWVFMSWSLVRGLVRDHEAVWVWNSSAREDGRLADDSGYWCDAVCDQVNTQPATRSLSPCFEWQWSSTVADIDAINISPQTFNRASTYQTSDSDSDFTSVRESLHRRNAVPESYPMAKHPKSVEVVAARAPAMLCPGQRLMVGLLRTEWLETIMTFRGLTLFYGQLHNDEVDDVIVPLVVKTNQLQGPLTAGRYSFFFDGVRIPFVKICDSLARLFLGICLGIAIGCASASFTAAMFCLIAVATMITLAYFSCTCPYNRRTENVLYGLMMLAISISAWIFMSQALNNSETSTVADTFLSIIIVVSLAMAIFSFIVSFSLYSAILCPPLPETRFIEKLSNCTVTIANHSDGVSVELPGWSKHPAKHVKVYSIKPIKGEPHISMYATGEEPNFEFSFDDMKNACRSGSLRPPAICLYSASRVNHLGYSHLNIFDKVRSNRVITEFLSTESNMRDLAGDLAKAVTRQSEALGDKSILIATIIPPKHEGGQKMLSDGSTTRSTSDGFSWSSGSSNSTTVTSSSSSSSSRGQSSSYAPTSTSKSASKRSRESGVEMTRH